MTHSRDTTGHPPEATPLLRSDSGLNLLFLAGFPLISWLFEGRFATAATAVVLAWTLSLALRLIARGTTLQQAYDASEVAFAPRIPRKLLGSLLIGGVVMVLAGHKLDTLVLPALVGLVAAALSLAAFGCDPLHDKGTGNSETARRLRAAQALAQSDVALARVADKVAKLGDTEVLRRTESARATVMHALRGLSGDPDAVLRVMRPVDRVISLIAAEADRLCSAADDNARFARRRYMRKLDAVAESFEGVARKARGQTEDDARAREADLLLTRMPQDTAA